MNEPDLALRRRHEKSLVMKVLVVVSSLSMVLGILAVYARDVLFDSDEAGELAVAAMADPEVRSAVVTEIVDQIVVLDQELLVVRPVIEVVVDGVLQSPEFADMVRFGVADLHRTVFTDASDTMSIQLVEVILFTKVSLAKLDPELAERIPDDVIDGLITLRSDPAFVDGIQLAESARALAFILPLLSFVGFASVIVLADDRRRAFTTVGVSAVVVAMLVLVLEVIGRAVFVTEFSDDDARRVARAIWDVLTADLIRLALFVAAAGAVLAGIATLGPGRVDLRSQIHAMTRALRPPESVKGRVAWGVVVVLAGALLVAEGEVVLRLVLVVVGIGLVVAGLAETVTALSGTVVREPAAVAGGERRTAWYRWVVGGLASVAGLAAILALVERSEGAGLAAGSGDPGCNGSILLCDRPLDRVAFATTHNSMAAANDGFTAAYQTVGIIPQLDAGYRGFLIDAYYGIETDEFVVTDRAPVTAEERAELVRDVGEAAVRSAEALRASRETAGGERDVYLCHSFCEAGAVSMTDEFNRIREWLEAHPREVLLFVVQDEGPTEQDIKRVLEESGLTTYVHSQDLEEPWPTLGELIDTGRRIWISAENSAGEEAWYHDAFTYIQDTPYSQPDVSAFTCELLRGDPDSPLLLVNHWLSPASPTAADEVNARAVLETRLQQCDDERGRFVNMLAVDFSDRGEVVAVVNDINGVAG